VNVVIAAKDELAADDGERRESADEASLHEFSAFRSAIGLPELGFVGIGLGVEG
jgi:hypothetical protein